MKLDIKNLNKSFGQSQILKNISFSAQSFKSLGLLGRNGAGKTTTIRILMDVIESDSGEILIDDKPIDRSSIKIGYLPEEKGLYAKSIVFDQLIYFGMLKGLSRKEAKDATSYWLSKVGMDEYKNKKLGTLSKGNQQKIQLIVSVLDDPDIVILDEPFSGLDPVNAMVLKNVIKEFVESGKMVIFSSHQMNYIEEFCEDIIIINNGSVVLSGEIKDIKRSNRKDALVLESDDNELLLKLINENLISYLNNVEMDNKQIIINMKSIDDLNVFMGEVLKFGIAIDKFNILEPTLNDIFVSYTNGGSI